MKKILISLALISSLNSAFSDIGSYTGTVYYVGSDWNYSRFLFSLNGAGGPCPFGQFSIDGTNPNYKESVALLMIAFSSGRKVNVNTDGYCPNNRANVIGVNVTQ